MTHTLTEQPAADSLPDGWEALNFESCVVNPDLPRKPSIPQNEYRPFGKIPIVDQGATFIAGYTDNVHASNQDLPVILFGDHTRALKYLDFRFATGADGTKLIFPNKERIDPKFFFFALKAINLASRGYNRHYSLLREQRILVPKGKEEQRAIAAVLSRIQTASQTQAKVVAALRELKSATMAEFFGTKRSAKSAVAWKKVRVDEVADLLSGGTPSKARPEWWIGNVPWASSKDLKAPRLYDTQDHITEEAAREYSVIVPKKTILMAIRGMALAKNIPLAITEVPMAFNQDLKAIVPGGSIDSDYLYYAIEFSKTNLDKEVGTTAHGTRRLGSDEVARLKVPIPPPATQREIARTLRAIEDRGSVASQSEVALSQLFGSTLAALMSGKLRVGGNIA